MKKGNFVSASKIDWEDINVKVAIFYVLFIVALLLIYIAFLR